MQGLPAPDLGIKPFPNADPGIAGAALVAFLVALMYAEGGVWRPLATIIILAVLITPPGGGKESVVSGLLKFINEVVSQTGVQGQ